MEKKEKKKKNLFFLNLGEGGRVISFPSMEFISSRPPPFLISSCFICLYFSEN